MDTRITNAFTIDVEDYFQVSAFDTCIDRSAWCRMECRIGKNLDNVLALLDQTHTRATFFVLAWIAEQYPDTVRRIAAAGHEIASHGYDHRRVTEMTVSQIREDIVRSAGILQDLSGQAVRGYRAPSFSVCRTNLWIHDLLLEAGYEYSSSIYPIHHDHYGIPESDRFCWRSRSGLLEIPLTSMRLSSANWPAAGGGYFRLLPYRTSRGMISFVNRVDGQPTVFYCHPWEIDPEQPRIREAGMKSRFRHYLNLDRTANRLSRLLRDFSWDRIDQVFASQLGTAEPAVGAAPVKSEHLYAA